MDRRVQVVVRTRPSEGGQSCVSISSEGKEVVVSDVGAVYGNCVPRSFYVDCSVYANCTNEKLFEFLVNDRIRTSVDSPDTSCFLAYGHTNSGKTHTIAGCRREPGLLSLAARKVLETHGVLEVSMLEVYGESVHDLLARGEKRFIRRRSSPEGVVIVVENLTCCSLSTLQEWEAVSAYGMETRRTAPTDRNSRSSRSHAIFTIKSHGVRLCMVDLAGSERQTTYSPQLNKESIAINKSLSRLSTVLEALSTTRKRSDGTCSYVNFRDTTLTVLLQRYLCGSSMTVFLACIHPDVQFIQETLSTMRYTQRLKRIKTKGRPQKPCDDLSLFRPSNQTNLLEELMMLRRIVGEKQYASLLRSSKHPGASPDECDGRLDYVSTTANPPQKESAGSSNLGSLNRRRKLLRSKDTRRVAGWLLSRILGKLPALSVGFDDYFDPFINDGVQVVGYVSLMACLPPRDAGDATGTLAFLDVGDLVMGFSMLDAGIPACVGLHRLNCGGSSSWVAHEYSEVDKVFVLAFFEVNEHLVESMNGTGEALECCDGLLTLEPLVPLALVLCTPYDASDELKESVLQHLITLQSDQEETSNCFPVNSASMLQVMSDLHPVDVVVKYPEEEQSKILPDCQHGFTQDPDETTDSIASVMETLKREVRHSFRDPLNQSHLSTEKAQHCETPDIGSLCRNRPFPLVTAPLLSPSSSLSSSFSTAPSTLPQVGANTQEGLTPSPVPRDEAMEQNSYAESNEEQHEGTMDTDTIGVELFQSDSATKSSFVLDHGGEDAARAPCATEVGASVGELPGGTLPASDQTILPAETVSENTAPHNGPSSVDAPVKQEFEMSTGKKRKNRRSREPVAHGCHGCTVA
ncbi:Kinesin motor domain [Trypanosoma vivax]|nr:Kinesin motor domain [Trypanosoma vivax]